MCSVDNICAGDLEDIFTNSSAEIWDLESDQILTVETFDVRKTAAKNPSMSC